MRNEDSKNGGDAGTDLVYCLPTDSGECRDDVRGVVFTLYEMITRDFHFRDSEWEQPHESVVQDLESWVQHPDVTLDRPVAEFRALLNAWVKDRKEGKKVAVYTDAPEHFDWPILKKSEQEVMGTRGRPYV